MKIIHGQHFHRGTLTFTCQFLLILANKISTEFVANIACLSQVRTLIQMTPVHRGDKALTKGLSTVIHYVAPS